MMKARAGELLLFGLSETNIVRLREGKPIRIDLAQLGAPTNVRYIVLFYGTNEAAIRQELADLIGPDTDFSDTTGSTH